MKKLILTNIVVVIAFILFDPLLNYFGDWADTYNLGMEMVLGILTPLLFGFFVLASLCLTLFSVIKCIANKEIKQFVPITIFVVGIVVYVLIFDSNSFWVRLINYYVNG